MTVKKLMDELTVYELREWMAYYMVDPFGTFRSDLNAAFICQQFGGGKVKDHMPDFGPRVLPTQEDLSKKLQSYFRGLATNPPSP
jgi:hypothetical protein